MKEFTIVGKSYPNDYVRLVFNPKNITIIACVDDNGSDFVITREKLKEYLK